MEKIEVVLYENGEEKAEMIRTENYIAMLRREVVPVLKRKKILNSCIIQQDAAHHTVLRRVRLG